MEDTSIHTTTTVILEGITSVVITTTITTRTTIHTDISKATTIIMAGIMVGITKVDTAIVTRGSLKSCASIAGYSMGKGWNRSNQAF
ncbi:hypothetical protein [Thalassoglobus polymorphus]|uniref:hypothetical protein n=1 Tax=Thalassoglobus polymorphus TaxID=2527994 RepID=UPI0011A55C28|nr:hypothetical protein [Thalassoglobus polymorphus]